MNPEVEKIINERMNELPKHTQNALRDLNWEDTLRIIGYRNTLLLDQIEILHRETYLLLLGLIHPDEYQSVLEKELAIEFDHLQKILNEVIHEIMEPLKDEIMERSNQVAADRSELFTETSKVQPNQTSNSVLPLHPKRDDVLAEIENPPKTTNSLSKLKLEDMFTQQPEQSTSGNTPSNEPSLAPAPSAPAPAPQPDKKLDYRTSDDDPYLEPVDEE